ncbi:MAG: hypothetical protein HY515_04260 [Candidatus Aenigmarchaeota archaeon]|nr:hypothetical protein [Candidatus Aenigmarchaeota archaeon]
MRYEPEKFEPNERAIWNFDWLPLKNVFWDLRRSPYPYGYYEQPYMTVLSISGKAFGIISQLGFLNDIRDLAWHKDNYWAHSSANRDEEAEIGRIYIPRKIRPKFGDSS